MKIKNIRKSKNLTQKQLAELADISEISVRKYEKNILNPKYSTLDKISKALNVSIFEFLDLEHQIESEFEEHFNIPQKVDTNLETQTMLNTTDKKLSISLMLTNFKSFNGLLPNKILDEDLDLLSGAIVNNIISTITVFKDINFGLLKQISKIEEENTELKKINSNLKNEVFAIENNLKLNIIHEPFQTLEEQEAFEKSLEDEFEKNFSTEDD